MKIVVGKTFGVLQQAIRVAFDNAIIVNNVKPTISCN
jgi:hypothetical protein